MIGTTVEKVSASTDRFSGRRYVNLESYRKNGEPVQTPVQSIEETGLIYVQTDPRTWKIKRIRNNPHIRIVPSDRNGKPTGTWADGDAEILQGEENQRILRLFRREYGKVGSVIVSFIARLRGERLTTVIKIKLRSTQ